MTLQEILKAKGLTDEQINEVIGEMKHNKIFTSAEENLDIRYGKLKTDFDALTKQHGESQKLITDLQNATKGQEQVQQQITDYQAQIAKQQEELTQAKTESALKICLLSAGAKASDIDYLIYKMSHDNDWKPVLDDNGDIKGLNDKVKGLKIQFPNQFESSSQKKIEEHKLEQGDDDKGISKEQFNKMGYRARVDLFNENPELYEELVKK